MNSIGTCIARLDGRLKVTGGAVYSAEQVLPHLACAYVIGGTIANGSITGFDTGFDSKGTSRSHVMLAALVSRVAGPGAIRPRARRGSATRWSAGAWPPRRTQPTARKRRRRPPSGRMGAPVPGGSQTTASVGPAHDRRLGHGRTRPVYQRARRQGHRGNRDRKRGGGKHIRDLPITPDKLV